MRGKACTCGKVHGKSRITPAYAGKSEGVALDDCFTKDHPRLCGEKSDRKPHSVPEQGSPPPMRGKDAADSRTADVSQDHPRLCGEKRQSFRGSPEQLGSPPPMRGKAVRYGEFFFYSGITPAYAGKSFRPHTMMQQRGDHPRLCGEKWRSAPSRKVPLRITPAYAGKRLLSR